MQSHYSLFEVNQYIRRAIALNFEESLWVSAEIAQINYSGRHAYLELWQKNEETDEIMAQSSAVIWAHKLQFVRQKMGTKAERILTKGTTILIKVMPEYHERYGLKFVVEDLDPSYTLGRIALERERTLLRLQEEGLLNKNKNLPWPQVLQKIAVISSPTSAGLQDFLNQIENNTQGYDFDITLYPVSVQGDRAASEIGAAVQKAQSQKPDLISIIRGGGSKMDLAAFDQYELSKSIALSSAPVLTAIGHQRDQSIADVVSASSVKTPTAAAEFVLQRNEDFEREIMQVYQYLVSSFQSRMQSEAQWLNVNENHLHHISGSLLSSESNHLEYLKARLDSKGHLLLESERKALETLYQVVNHSDPKIILAKGYSITKKNGSILQDSKEIQSGDIVKTVLHKGVIQSQIL